MTGMAPSDAQAPISASTGAWSEGRSSLRMSRSMLAVVQVARMSARARRMLYVAAGVLTLIGIFAMRWNVVIGGQLFSKSFLGYTTYKLDFATREGQRIMVVGLTTRQWQNLVEATGIHDACAQIEKLLGVDLSDEGDRFAARE